jgi:predicted RND superfamily exporter protein
MPTIQDRRHRIWNRLSDFISKSAVTIALIGLGLMLLAGFGLQRVRTSINVQDLLAGSSRTLRDYRWLESNLGPMASVEIIVRFDRDNDWDILRRIQLVRVIQAKTRQLEHVGGVTSVATFAPGIPRARGIRSLARRSLIRRTLERQRPDLIASDWLHETAEQQSWRISARVAALENVDHGQFLQRLRDHLSPLLVGPDRPGIAATYTGLTPMVYAAQRALLNDLIASFLTALSLVTLIVVLVQGSIGVGLLAMIPNVFPAMILFGTMGWLNVKVDIGSVMTASVALGMAVDGTIHFLTWYRRERRNNCTPAEAVRHTYHHCGTAMTETTIICGLGMLVFAASGFVPTRRFAFMMAALLSTALVGDLVLLPALILSPVGQFVFRGAPNKLANGTRRKEKRL